jgi:hypothetical protein
VQETADLTIHARSEDEARFTAPLLAEQERDNLDWYYSTDEEPKSEYFVTEIEKQYVQQEFIFEGGASEKNV